MSEWSNLPLYQFIEKLSPEFKPPYHLKDWVDLLERASKGERIRALCSIPIRHYKTETTLAGIVKILNDDPTTRVIYLTFSVERAHSVGKRLRQLAEATPAGPAKGWNTIGEWRNDAGGGVVVMSADQSKIGYDCHVLIVDDPLDEHDAEDALKRDAVDNTINHYSARCMRRGKPGPVLILMSRLHPDDPVGRRLNRRAVIWDYVHKPVIIDEGEPTERAFAPDVWDLPELKAMRAELAEKDPTERYWWSQLMGDPRPAGTDLFGPPTLYTSLPDYMGFKRGYGIDMAYTVGDGADWFALVAARIYGRKIYLLDVTRHKIDPTLIESTCKAYLNKYGYDQMWSYMSGPEVGLARILRERGVPIAKRKARYNKLVRAERTIKRWNSGDILVPADAPWAHGFLTRIGCFRGRERDTDDDEIDALVSMCDSVMGTPSGADIKTFGKPGYSGMR